MSTLGSTSREEEKSDGGRCEGATARNNGGGTSGPALVVCNFEVLSHIHRNSFEKLYIHGNFSPFAASTSDEEVSAILLYSRTMDRLNIPHPCVQEEA